MRLVLVILLGILVGVLGVVGYASWQRPDIVEVRKELPFLKYTIGNLGKRVYDSEIFLDEAQPSPKATAGVAGFTVYKFHFSSDGRRVNGLAHLPNSCNKCPVISTDKQCISRKCPVIAQFRGYQDVEKYKTGDGTRRTAQKFAEAGFISLAPDFLGYGGSASPSANVWEARFETYTTALNLLAAIERWENTENIGIWGHSNGGQVALTVLEISGKEYTTVLWAPVTAPFPYSVLYYTDDILDHGKLLRKELAQFEKDYDVEQYSLQNYLDLITAPVLLQQGTADDQVPVRWSRGLAGKMKNVEYVEYPGADHNLSLGWTEAVNRAIEFYRKSW